MNENAIIGYRCILSMICLLLSSLGFSFAPATNYGYFVKSDATCRIWWVENTHKIMKGDPLPHKKGRVMIKAARNEGEGFQLSLLPVKDLEKVSVTITDFKRKTGEVISADNVVIRKVEYVNVTKPSGLLHHAGWYPDPLPLLEHPFNAQKEVNSPIWFTVKVPMNAAPGIYNAVIIIKCTGWEAAIPVELEVWDFTLPEVPYMRSAFGLYSGMVREYHNLENDDELKQVMDAYYRAFKEYKISPQQFHDLYPIKKEVKGVHWKGGTFDPDTVYRGRYSYQINGNKAGQADELIRVDPTRPYLLKWWAKTLNKNQQYAVTVKCYTSEKELIPWQVKGMICTGNTYWHEDSVYIDPKTPLEFNGLIVSRPFPSQAVYASVHLFSVVPDDKGSRSGTIWFDDLRFLDVKTKENLLPIGDFEQKLNELDVELDFTEFDKAARKYLDSMGFSGFRVQLPELRPGPYFGHKTAWFGGFINGTAEYKKLINIYLKSFQDHLEVNGWLGKEYLYWIDEPKQEDYAFVREGMLIIHEAAPKLTRFITENNPGPEIMDVTETGCPVLTKFDPVKSKKWIEQGREIWSYLMCWPKEPYLNLFIDSDAINMRMWLWMSYSYGLTGILVWTSNYWNADECSPSGVLQNIWEDPMSYWDGDMLPTGSSAEFGNGDGMFFYPPNRDPNHDKTKYLTGPVPSLRLEIQREGLDDYDYMKILEKCLKNGLAGQQSLVREAQKLLTIKSDVFVNDHEYTKDPRVLLKYRNQMAQLICKFNEK